MDRSEKPCPICVSIVDHRICGVYVEKESGGGIEINKRQARRGSRTDRENEREESIERAEERLRWSWRRSLEKDVLSLTFDFYCGRLI